MFMLLGSVDQFALLKVSWITKPEQNRRVTRPQPGRNGQSGFSFVAHIVGAVHHIKNSDADHALAADGV
jgi:hypothetical protein